MRYRFIQSHRHRWPIAPMCRVLRVSRSGYYAWRTRPENRWEGEDRLLAIEIKAIHVEADGHYGSPRMTLVLNARGISCSENRVARIMREYGIRAKRARRFKATTDSGHDLPVAPNLLERDFEPEGPNRVWAADITYVPTDEGWLYLAVVLDLWSRKIVGWSVRSRMTQRLVIEALRQAIADRKPEEGLIAHSDRDSQYCSAAYRRLLERQGMTQSMARKGEGWDNAPVESFFSTLKLECIYQNRYKTRQQARRDIFAYIEAFYNTKRIHTSIGNQSPVAYEELMSSA